MSDESRQFNASEVFAYVDTYRSGIHKSAEILREDKEKLEKRYWEQQNPDPRMLAELRALEHALLYVEKGEEPGVVVLAGGGADGGTSAAELKECQEQLEHYAGERVRYEQKIKQLKNQGEELHTEAVRYRQQWQILQRRLAQSNSTFVVVVMTMFMVILVQLYLLWSR
ncbi:MAG: hypothetical protein ACQETD_03100 [Pseudomonadota bacterium]